MHGYFYCVLTSYFEKSSKKMLIMSFRAYRYFVNLNIFKIETSARFLDEKY